MTAPRAQDFSISMNLALFGIGAQLTEDDGYCTMQGGCLGVGSDAPISLPHQSDHQRHQLLYPTAEGTVGDGGVVHLGKAGPCIRRSLAQLAGWHSQFVQDFFCTSHFFSSLLVDIVTGRCYWRVLAVGRSDPVNRGQNALAGAPVATTPAATM